VGTNNKKYYKQFGLRENQLIFAPHAIENERFSFDHSEQATTLRESLGVSKSQILILFAGKFEQKKDPLLLLEAFISLQDPRTHLLFVGNGALEEILKERAKVSDKRIHLLNFQNQSIMPTIYQACDLFCLPSKGPGETWGLAINEAMAAGKAVLASDKVGCAIDLIKTDVNGYIFRAGDKEDILEKLKLLGNLNKLKEFGENSASLIKAWSLKYTAESLIKELEDEN
jgi:glycosyltransferase involved in cell wall biosynthesis